jgi:drug/metabolite transporter (DMT)-like permease
MATGSPARSLALSLPDRATLLSFALAVVIGGSNAVAVRFSNLELAPFWGAALRFGLAAIAFWGIVLARRLSVPRGQSLLGATLYGATGIGGGYAFLYWSLTRVPASLAMVVLATVPLMTLLFAAVHRLEPFRWRGALGALVALAGIALSVGNDIGGAVPLASRAGLIAGGALIAESSVVVKLFPSSDPVVTNAVALTTGTAILLPLSLLAGEARSLPSSGTTWAAFAYLVVIGSILLFYLYLSVLQRWTASATSYSFLLFPLVTVVVASWLAGEEVSAEFLAGTAVVMAGVWLGALSRR